MKLVFDNGPASSPPATGRPWRIEVSEHTFSRLCEKVSRPMDFQTLAGRWVGARAETYDADKQRYERLKGQHEHRVVAQILRKVGHGKCVLDVPVGTGRFLELYSELRQEVTGIDVSGDMLAQAKARSRVLGCRASFLMGDIRRIPYGKGHFDVVVCTRFLSWIDTHGIASVLAELTRVSRRHLIIGARHFLSPRDLGLPTLSGLQMYGRQLNRRVRQALRRNRFTNIHSFGAIKRMFDSNDLQMVYCESTERRHADGTESAVYWLIKAGSE